MDEVNEIGMESLSARSSVRELAKRALLATGLSAFSTHCGEGAGKHDGLMRLAGALLTEAATRGFASDLELRGLLAAGLISARTLDLLDESLACIPEEVIGEIVMTVTMANAGETVIREMDAVAGACRSEVAQ